jgi:2'-5' RNA ligase
MNRLFIALPVDKKIISHVFENLSEKKSFNNFRWEKKENIHITLKFLGDTEDNLIDDIDNRLKNIALNFNSFDLKLNKIGTFNRNGKPFILWFNFYKNESVELLNKKIEEELLNLGFNKENRDYNPHVTLLRVKNEEDSETIKSYKDIKFEPIEYCVNELYLIKSTLTPKGSLYTKIKTYKLK